MAGRVTLLLMAVFCILATTAWATNHQISIVDFAFILSDTTISIGQNIRRINFGAMQHTTTDTTAHHWDSGTLNPGNTFTLHADSVGVYHYICPFHPASMFGAITVRDTSSLPAVCAYRPGEIN